LIFIFNNLVNYDLRFERGAMKRRRGDWATLREREGEWEKGRISEWVTLKL